MRPPSDKIKEPSFFDLVYDAVCRIPKGKVATYGQIAFICGSPRAARVVDMRCTTIPARARSPATGW